MDELKLKKDLDKWAENFNTRLVELADQPMRELFTEGLGFCDWRLSYGIKTYTPVVTYFLSIYPAFCMSPKFTWHYSNMAQLALDVIEIETFMDEPPPNELKNGLDRDIKTQDIIATVFAVLRDKESVELFQDQKDLMELGLKHYHLDNYYQDMIRTLCKEYEESATFLGKPFDLNIFKKIAQKNG